ncbi:hypothetical protein LB467_07400 [Salegentibacter sp. JZCK2]|uniref:hypothetical protein n=1 Tax=Salegentibacter tibetensis TaxID=2873600 RepID=UPI001CCB2A2E|nr:hypothetical protein [Salegentibacter tibetensis]MBZ9729511.1 hypothetical protein [Salegentibacter tibetensis]
MENIHLKVKSKEACKNLMQFLKKFSKNELEIISESDFEKQKAELEKSWKQSKMGIQI